MFYKADQGQIDAECFFISLKRCAVLLFRGSGDVSYFFSYEHTVYNLSFPKTYSTIKILLLYYYVITYYSLILRYRNTNT